MRFDVISPGLLVAFVLGQLIARPIGGTNGRRVNIESLTQLPDLALDDSVVNGRMLSNQNSEPGKSSQIPSLTYSRNMASEGFGRVVWIVLDSVGIGEMQDAAEYGDSGSDTLGHVASARPLQLPNLVKMGLANIKPLAHLEPVAAPTASFGKCALASPGKDTTTGHWEMVGIHLAKPFPLYPHGFPPEVMEEFERRSGRGTLGNKAASGTEIIKELGEEHVRTGKPIVYTSADSVFQIAAHEDVIPLWELYKMCETARSILRGPFEVGRVIARPFEGEAGGFVRTANRRDFAVPPPKGMLLDQLEAKGIEVYSVGKIFDVFLGRGIGPHEKTRSNADGMAKTLSALGELERGLLFVNLVDFDQQYGHRNDVEGYARALEEVDAWLPSLLAALKPTDMLVMTADHGCDPTTPSTDHSREYVPLLVLSPRNPHGMNLGIRPTLSDIGQTVAENFGVRIGVGESFLEAVA
jgi:phosphopentomutase